MRQLNVDLGDRSYPIYIGEKLLANKQFLAPYIQGRQICIVTNETIAPLYLSSLQDMLTGYQLDTVVLPDGEAHKNLETLNLIFDGLLRARHNRTTTLIALGGGVVGDMTGFAAACYQRGVDFIQVPTTLLSMVDSSVGHTFGHAIETAQGYGNWLHGEAVAAGMVMAADLSWRRGAISQADLERTIALLKQAKLPVKAPADMTSETFLTLMGVDKKVLDGRLRLVLLESMGKAVITSDVDAELLAQTFVACR